jgi:hypothetical protein
MSPAILAPSLLQRSHFMISVRSGELQDVYWSPGPPFPSDPPETLSSGIAQLAHSDTRHPITSR